MYFIDVYLENVKIEWQLFCSKYIHFFFAKKDKKYVDFVSYEKTKRIFKFILFGVLNKIKKLLR